MCHRPELFVVYHLYKHSNKLGLFISFMSRNQYTIYRYNYANLIFFHLVTNYLQYFVKLSNFVALGFETDSIINIVYYLVPDLIDVYTE